MWLKARELASELHISVHAVNNLRKRRRIRFINLGDAKHPNYRYEMPAPSQLAPVTPPVERIALLTYQEFGAILGISFVGVRVGVTSGRFFPIPVGKRKMFTIAELRRVLALRENRAGQDKQGVSKILVEWVQRYLMGDAVPVSVLERLLEKAGRKLPEPARSEAITALWNHFDAVNEILRKIDGPGGGS